MADLTDLQAAGTTKVIGSDATGLETNPLSVDSGGAITVQPGNTANTTAWLVNATSAGPVTAGTVATKSDLMGGQFNTVLPTLTTGQQAALQVDSNGRLIIGQADTINSGVLGALNATVQILLAGQMSASIQLAAGTLIGTILPEVSSDGGSIWNSTYLSDPGTGALIGSLIFGSANTAQFKTVVVPGGVGLFRMRVSAFTSGTANITIRASDIANPISLYTGIAGLPTPPNTLLMGGTDSTNLRNLLTDTTGRLITSTVDGQRATYSAIVLGLTVAASPTDVFTITGSATKIVRINRISVTGTQTTAAVKDFLLIKRSAANTAGTSTTPINVPHDSTTAAGTATVRAYTVNPTALGAAVGTIRTRKTFIPTTLTQGDEFAVEFGTRNSQAIVLRGVAEVLALNLNSIASAGSSFDMYIEWTEE